MVNEDIRASFGSLVSQTTRRWRRAVDRQLHPFGLTEATWLPLLRVARAPTPLRQKDLASSLSLDGSSIVRILDALETGGLIERREEDGDRRAKSVVLTPAGRETVRRVEWAAREVRDHALAAISDADLRTTTRVLEHVARLLEDREGADEP